MLIDFFAHRGRLNVIQLVVTFVLVYGISTRFTIGQTILLTLLVIVINLITHARATADGMLLARLNKKLFDELLKNDKEKRKKKG